MMPPDWLDTLRVGDVFMALWTVGVVIAVGRWVYLPLAKKAREFYKDWGEIQYQTRDFQNELVQTHQAQKQVIESVYEAVQRMEKEGYHRYAEGGWIPPRDITEENYRTFIVESAYASIEIPEAITYPNPYVADAKPHWDRYVDMPEEQEKTDPKPVSENEETNASTE